MDQIVILSEAEGSRSDSSAKSKDPLPASRGTIPNRRFLNSFAGRLLNFTHHRSTASTLGNCFVLKPHIITRLVCTTHVFRPENGVKKMVYRNP
jgi:hypothetical protein